MKKSIIALSVTLIIVMLTGCKTTKTAVSKENLMSTAWELSSIEGKSVEEKDYPKGFPNAIFAPDNRISGHGGCNRYSGSYTLDAEGKLLLSQMISTKMFCQGIAENVYIKALGRVNRAKIEGNNLVLYYENETVLVFVPKKLE